MTTPPETPESRWESLLHRARADVAPQVDVTALLRVVERAPKATPSPARSAWTQDFAAVFGSARVISGCLAGAAALALVASWQVWDSWQTLPWMELLDVAAGGAS